MTAAGRRTTAQKRVLAAGALAVALITVLTTMSGKLSQTFTKVSTSLDAASK